MKVDTNLSNEQYFSKTKEMLNLSSNTSKNNIYTDTDIALEFIGSDGEPTKEAYQNAVNKLNEFMDYTNRNSKFVFHEELDKYYVEIVDSETNEVVKEIPPKQLLDAFYEMRKLAGKIFDQQA